MRRILVAVLCVFALMTQAEARYARQNEVITCNNYGCSDHFGRYNNADTTPAKHAGRKVHNKRQHKQDKLPVQATTEISFSNNSLVSEARKYIGTNPTGRARLWCGAFVDYVLRKTGHKPGSNLASDYARYGTRIGGPQVGAIAVMSRRGGGHVGIVTGLDANGNVTMISGNTWNRSSGGRRTTLEHSYPRGRIYTYVVP